MCQNGNPHHVIFVVDLHLQSHIPTFLFISFFFSFLRRAGLLFCKEREACLSFFFLYKSPSNSPFLLCSLGKLIYGLPEISNSLETATSQHNPYLFLASLTHSFSVGFALFCASVPCSVKQENLSCEFRQKADFAWGQCRAL